MVNQRVSTGVDALDEALGGGFPRGSMILLAGNPGTGKTVFSAQFLCKGARDFGENGVYVSLAEDKGMFLDNISRHLGDDYASLFGSRCSFLDLITLRGEGLSAVLETILSEIKHYKASRLVIDSFTAIAQAFERPIDARIAIHTLIRRLVRELGCTTLLISETPFGEERIGLGMEEFVADGVILLKMGELEDRFFREIEVRKMRG